MNTGQSTLFPGRTWPGFLSAAVVLLLLALVAGLHLDRAAWYDEAWLVDFLGSESPAATLKLCIERSRPAAVGYVVALWPIQRMMPDSLEALRVPSAVLGVVMVVAAAWLGFAWSGLRSAAWLAPVFLLAGPLLQRYLTEIKQYAPEAALTVALIVATALWAQSRRAAAAALWLALALLCLLVTFSAWFAVAACGLVIFARWLRPLDKRQIVITLAFGGVIAIVAAAVHLGFNRHIAGSDQMQGSWAREFIPLSARYPLDLWNRLADMLARSWYTFSLPRHALLGAAGLGWLCWLRRHPLSALAAGLTVVITIAANAAGLWPLGVGARVRVNLPIITIFNLCLIALPLGLVGMAMDFQGRRRPATTSATDRRRTPLPEWAGFVFVVLLSAYTVLESRGADYEVAQVRELLQQAGDHAKPGDRVVLEQTADVNRRYLPLTLSGEVVLGPWPGDHIIENYAPLALSPGAEHVYFLAGHHNEALRQHWQSLMDQLSAHGQTKLVWSGNMAALYRFTPAPPSSTAPR